MRYLIAFFFMLVCSYSYAGDYVCYDEKGEITQKYRSVDGNFIADKGKCLKIDRDTYTTLDKWKKVEGEKVVEISQVEKDAIILKEKEAKDKAEADRILNGDISMQELLTVLYEKNVIKKDDLEVLK